MDYTYLISACRLEVYFGKLEKDYHVNGGEEELVWMNLDEDFFDMARFAGEGSIGHIFEQLKVHDIYGLAKYRSEVFEFNSWRG